MGLRYFINNLTGKLEDGKEEKILPKPKPAKPIADQYQDYLKVESYLEPKSQMFVRDEMGFNQGGNVESSKIKLDLNMGGRIPLQEGGGAFSRWLNKPTVKNVIAAELGLEGLLQLYSLLGMPIMAEGGRVGYEGGGITTLHPRRPEALPPKSGPMPQGGGLSSMFNRAREW